MKFRRAEICPLPFTRLSLHPDGRVTPCCFLNDYVLGSAQKQTYEKMWNGEKIRALRREFIAGNPRICRESIQYNSCNVRAADQRLSVRELRERVPFPMPRLDVSLNGRCNLECIMCSVWTQPNGVYDGSRFWKEGPEKIFPQLERILIKGGEPFIQKDTFRLIDEISRVNKGCLWSFTTNGHYSFNGTLKSYLDKIHIESLAVSIDSLKPEIFSQIRLKGRLELVLKSLDCLIAYRDGLPLRKRFTVTAMMVIQRDNFAEAPDLISFCRSKNIAPQLVVAVDPEPLSILKLPPDKLFDAACFFLKRAGELESPTLLRIARAVLPHLPPGKKVDVLLASRMIERTLDAQSGSRANMPAAL